MALAKVYNVDVEPGQRHPGRDRRRTRNRVRLHVWLHRAGVQRLRRARQHRVRIRSLLPEQRDDHLAAAPGRRVHHARNVRRHCHRGSDRAVHDRRAVHVVLLHGGRQRHRHVRDLGGGAVVADHAADRRRELGRVVHARLRAERRPRRRPGRWRSPTSSARPGLSPTWASAPSWSSPSNPGFRAGI